MREKAKKSTADYIRQLLNRVSELEERVQSTDQLETRLEVLETRISALDGGPASSPDVDVDVVAHVVELESRFQHIEDENTELAGTCTLLREQNEAIANLYVAKHRLHASLDAAEIMDIVTEILVELIGAEEFAIFFLDPRSKVLKRAAGRGAGRVPETIPAAEGLVGMVATNGKPFYYESSVRANRAAGVPLAAIPLKSGGKPVGVIAVYRLLPHKNAFTPVDHQLLELVAEHTPNALLSARLHQRSQDKTPRGV